jgi:hypothetical protein
MMAAVREITVKADPFGDLPTKTVREVLLSKGWAGVVEDAAGLALELGELVVVVATGKLGESNLSRLVGAHGELPPAPRYQDSPRGGDPRTVRVFRRPAGLDAMGLPNAVNLHGSVPGVSVLAVGREVIPPSSRGGVTMRWQREAHAATTPVRDLPAWLLEMTRDPAAAARAWGTAKPTGEAARVLGEWERELTMHRGRPAPTFANACTVLRSAPWCAGRLVFDELVQGPAWEGKPITEGTIGRIRERCEREMGVAFGGELLRSAMQTVAEERRVHPVREYLDRVVWDGVPRLDAVAGTILGAAEPLAAVMARRFFVGAVARVMKPGCKLDTMLVLVGPQGAKKSTFYQVLFGQWFTDTHVDLSSKDAFLQLAGSWGIEWGEIERVTGRRGADEIKSFLSSRLDRFRPPYGRSIVEVPRACVLVGSTNQDVFLDDDTGSRRFWCVRCVGSLAIDTLTAWRDQLWAEARAAFEAGEPWWLGAEDEEGRAEDADRHTSDDPWAPAVLRWVKKTQGEDFTAAEVLKGALDVPVKDHDKHSQTRVGRILRKAKWERRKHRPFRDGTKGEPVWCWFRPEDPDAPTLTQRAPGAFGDHPGADDDMPS